MLSIPSHEYTDSADSAKQRQNGSASKERKPRLRDQLDEIAVFAFVAVGILYIAAATYGLIW